MSSAESNSDPRRVRDLEQLLEVTRHLAVTVELDPLLRAIIDAAVTVLQCDRGTVFLCDEARGELYSRVAMGDGDQPASEIRIPIDRGIAGEVARTGHIVNVPDAYADERFNPDVDRSTGYRTRNILTFPLLGHDGAIVGVLQVLNKHEGSFDQRDNELGQFLGAQAGVAIQRQMLLEHFAEKERLQRDLNIARDIQRGLLPRKNPEVEGFDIAGWNEPADETGGDCYDFVALEDGSLAMTIADATGHGIGPALVAAEMRALFRASIGQTNDLIRVQRQVNAVLVEDLPADRFVTAFFGRLIPSEAALEFTSCGHGPMLLYERATNTVKELNPHGVPLGIMIGLPHPPPDRWEMKSGDMMVLLTDGFIERSDGDREQFGTPRLIELIQQNRDLSAGDLIRAMYQRVMDFGNGSPQTDDFTAVIVRKL